jgi:hypothetical protein
MTARQRAREKLREGRVAGLMSSLQPPGPDFATFDLAIESVQPDSLLRLASSDPDSHLRFRRSPWFRFDSPNGRFGVLYAAFALETAFVETVLRDKPVVGRRGNDIPLAYSDLVRRRVISFASVGSRAVLKLVRLHGDGLASAGVDNRISSVEDYHLTRQWAKAMHDHPTEADGILYMSRYSGSGLNIALFDRCASKLRVAIETPLLTHPDFADVADRFNLAIDRGA